MKEAWEEQFEENWRLEFGEDHQDIKGRFKEDISNLLLQERSRIKKEVAGYREDIEMMSPDNDQRKVYLTAIDDILKII